MRRAGPAPRLGLGDLEEGIDRWTLLRRVLSVRCPCVADDALELLRLREPPVGVTARAEVLGVRQGRFPVHGVAAVGLDPHQAGCVIRDRAVAVVGEVGAKGRRCRCGGWMSTRSCPSRRRIR